ncbi:hypothetical protein [Polaribacter sp. IC073]|nr:hypothetical protein [Polaribacter sp. IC073]
MKATFDDGDFYSVESKFDSSDTFFKTTDHKGLFIVRYNPDLTLTRIN